MFGIFSRRLSELDDSDLRELVEVRKLREHTHLDYKKQMYEHTWYGSNDNGKKEMLGDITAMANARGGYILIGVEEDETEPDGTPKALVGIPNGDQEARWIEDVCIDSIDEKIAGLQTRAIEISGTASCVVVQVPNSLRKPHMVSRGSYRSFSRRHGQRNAQMDMPEIRSMIISMSQYRESLAYFLVERKEAFARSAGKEPQLLLMATPIYGDRDKVDTSRFELLRHI
jgi:predicted HTH transcriptional regulator